MPFKVKYRIYEPDKQAPCMETYDRALAYIEWKNRRIKQPMTRLVPEVTPDRLTKPEEYVWLVYRVLKAIRKYYDERNYVSKEQSQDNLHVSLALEKELDNWNTRTRFHIQGHPKMKPDDPNAFAFFEVVEEWRKQWHSYFAYKNKRDKDPAMEREMKKACFQMESEIKKYVRLVIGI